MTMRLKLALLLVAICAFAQAPKPDWSKWWPHFQAAVASHDAEAVAAMTAFPAKWEVDKNRKVESKTVFVQNFDAYFPEHMRQAVASEKPKTMADGTHVVSWSHDVDDYAVFFKPDGKGGYRLSLVMRNKM